MKKKRLIASIAAMTVLGVSSLSSAMINIKDSNVVNIKINTPAVIELQGTTSVGVITKKAGVNTTVSAIGESVTVGGESVTQGAVKVEEAEKQKCETLLYKQVA